MIHLKFFDSEKKIHRQKKKKPTKLYSKYLRKCF